MKIVLLSGGEGTRLWPLSTKDCPKQYLKLIDNNKTMLQITYEKILEIFSNIYIATQENHLDIIRKQINNNNFIIEPDKRGTFAAILNIAVYLKYEKNIDENECVAVLPTDHDVESNFYNNIKIAEKLLMNDCSKSICLIGIKPNFISTNYGYITYDKNQVLFFHEKPNEEKAKKLIHNNALWNSGIVVFKLKYILELTKKYMNYNSYEEFYNKYLDLPGGTIEWGKSPK